MHAYIYAIDIFKKYYKILNSTLSSQLHDGFRWIKAI